MNNIKIIGNVINTQRISRFNPKDNNLLISNDIIKKFGINGDYIELFLYDSNNNLLDINYNYKGFKLPSNSFLNSDSTFPIIEINPIQDIQDLGYNNGSFKVKYNLFNSKFSTNQEDLFISEISNDRTELRINSINIPSVNLIEDTKKLINELENNIYQKYYILNFNNDIQQVIINIALSEDSILLKLHYAL